MYALLAITIFALFVLAGTVFAVIHRAMREQKMFLGQLEAAEKRRQWLQNQVAWMEKSLQETSSMRQHFAEVRRERDRYLIQFNMLDEQHTRLAREHEWLQDVARHYGLGHVLERPADSDFWEEAGVPRPPDYPEGRVSTEPRKTSVFPTIQLRKEE